MSIMQPNGSCLSCLKGPTQPTPDSRLGSGGGLGNDSWKALWGPAYNHRRLPHDPSCCSPIPSGEWHARGTPSSGTQRSNTDTVSTCTSPAKRPASRGHWPTHVGWEPWTLQGYMVPNPVQHIAYRIVHILVPNTILIQVPSSISSTLHFFLFFLYNTCMSTADDKRLIALARRYRLRIGSMKCQAFDLFDQGNSATEVCYLLRRFTDPAHPYALSHTIRRYRYQWRKSQDTG